MAGPTLTVHPAARAAPEPQAAGRAPVALRWTRVALDGLAAVLPSEVRTTRAIEDALRPLYARLGLKPGWVETVTGIRTRRLWGPGEGPVAGAVDAARRALAEAGRTPADVDAVISCSVYKPRLEPSVACEIQGALGVGAHAFNFDLANACLGFLSGLHVAADMIELGRIDTALVVSGEDARPVLNATLDALTSPGADIHSFKAHLATLTLGSAAAAAVLVRADRARHGHRLIGGTVVSAAEHHGLCVGDAGGMQTDSVTLLREGVALAGRTRAAFDDVLDWRDRVDVAALHQVGRAHHEAVLRQLAVPADRAPQTYADIGNIGSCGVPVTAAIARDQGRLAPGDRLALMGIGSGLNCMMLGVEW